MNICYLTHENGENLGNVVILAVLYPAVDDIISRYASDLASKIVIDITNPLNFETFDALVVLADGSAANEIQVKLADSSALYK